LALNLQPARQRGWRSANLATVAAVEACLCPPSTWNAAASGVGGPILAGARAMAVACSGAHTVAAVRPAPSTISVGQPSAAARWGFRRTPLEPRTPGMLANVGSTTGVAGIGLCRATTLGYSVVTVRPVRRVSANRGSGKRIPWQWYAHMACNLSGTRNGQTSTGGARACSRHGLATGKSGRSY